MGGATGNNQPWTWYGGANASPKYHVRNSIITGAAIFTLSALVFQYSAQMERRVRYPDGWIPSMLWAKEFHDPSSVAMWKKRLKEEGREWIEPIPAWWPFK